MEFIEYKTQYFLRPCEDDKDKVETTYYKLRYEQIIESGKAYKWKAEILAEKNKRELWHKPKRFTFCNQCGAPTPQMSGGSDEGHKNGTPIERKEGK